MSDTRPIRVRLEEALLARPRDRDLVTYLQAERAAELTRETGNHSLCYSHHLDIFW